MTITEVVKHLKKIPGWRYNARKKVIWAEFRLKDFVTVVKMINRIAKLAERMDHHPDLHLTRYRRLKIVLTTHSAGAVTAKDFKLARFIVR